VHKKPVAIKIGSLVHSTHSRSHGCVCWDGSLARDEGRQCLEMWPSLWHPGRTLFLKAALTDCRMCEGESMLVCNTGALRLLELGWLLRFRGKAIIWPCVGENGSLTNGWEMQWNRQESGHHICRTYVGRALVQYPDYSCYYVCAYRDYLLCLFGLRSNLHFAVLYVQSSRALVPFLKCHRQ
jgi:hypothetical protein